jgi:hypothetical protein
VTDDPKGVTDPALRDRVNRIQLQLTEGLAAVDPHHKLSGRPVTYRVVSGRTLEIVFQDVTGVSESEFRGLKRLIGEECFCSVLPQTAETVTVRIVVPLTAPGRS